MWCSYAVSWMTRAPNGLASTNALPRSPRSRLASARTCIGSSKTPIYIIAMSRSWISRRLNWKYCQGDQEPQEYRRGTSAGIAKLSDESGCGILIKQIKVKVKAEVEINYARSFSTLTSASALIEELSYLLLRSATDKEFTLRRDNERNPSLARDVPGRFPSLSHPAILAIDRTDTLR